MSLEKNDAVELVQVGNGFVVKRPYSMVRGGEITTAVDEVMVFNSFAGLVAFLSTHFAHRSSTRDVTPDAGELY